MISREDLSGQLENLTTQRREVEANLHRIEGEEQALKKLVNLADSRDSAGTVTARKKPGPKPRIRTEDGQPKNRVGRPRKVVPPDAPHAETNGTPKVPEPVAAGEAD